MYRIKNTNTNHLTVFGFQNGISSHFDWGQYSDDEINMQFQLVTNPHESPVPIGINETHTFTTYCSITIKAKSSQPAYTTELIDQSVAMYPKENQSAIRKYMEEQEIRVLDFVVTDFESQKMHNFIIDESRLKVGPVDITSSKLSYAIYVENSDNSLQLHIKPARYL